MDKRHTYLWLLVKSEGGQVDLQICGTLLHQHAPLHFILSHFLFKSVLREARVVEVVPQTRHAKMVAILVKVVGKVRSRLDEIESRPARGRLDIRVCTVVEKKFGNLFMSVRCCPHQGTPLVPVLLIHQGAGVQKRRDDFVMSLHESVSGKEIECCPRGTHTKQLA